MSDTETVKPNLAKPWEAPYQRVATTEDILYCFRLLLGRFPNREEWKGHAAQAGNDLDRVVSAYIGSLEFARRKSALLNHQLNDRIFLKELKGFSIYGQEEDSAVSQPVKGGVYEPHVAAIFRNYLKPGMRVLDVGANIGYFTMLSASLVTPTGHVMAIEPNPANAKLLEASRRANHFDNVVIVQAAAGAELGLLVLNTAHSNGTTSRPSDNLASLMDSTTVACLKIDDILSCSHVDFVKIDVEGSEYSALLGASEMIRRCHPVIVSEFSPDSMPDVSGAKGGTRYLQFLLDFGYKISVIEYDGSITNCGSDTAKVMEAYSNAGVDHIDILID